MFSRHYVPLLQVIAALGKNELQVATWLCINVFKIMSIEVMDGPSIPTASVGGLSLPTAQSL
jgi:hypothetical protein